MEALIVDVLVTGHIERTRNKARGPKVSGVLPG
jgi:hypothetical protein